MGAETNTYILRGGKHGRDGGVLQVADAPSNIEAVLCKMFAAQVLMSTRGPLLPLHVVHPSLKPGLVLQRKALEGERKLKVKAGLKQKLFVVCLSNGT